MGITGFFDNIGDDVSSCFGSVTSDFGNIGGGLFGDLFGGGNNNDNSNSGGSDMLEYGLIAVVIIIMAVMLKKYI